MEPNQVHLVAFAMPCDSQEILHALEPRFTGEVMRDISQGHRRDGIHDDMPIVHPVAGPHLDMRARPDANAAPDSPATDSLAKRFREHHLEPQVDARTRWSDWHIPTHVDANAAEGRYGGGDRTGNRVRIQPAYRNVTCR